MKCIQCGTDSKLRDRTENQGRCKQCNHPFAFEPTDQRTGIPKLTDPLFAKLIFDISVDNTLYFTSKQFLYWFDRRLKHLINYNVDPLSSCFLMGCSLLNPLFFVFSIAFFLKLLITGNSPKSSRHSRRRQAITVQTFGVVVLLGGAGLGFLTNSAVWFGSTALVGLSIVWLSYFQLKRSSEIPETFVIEASKMQGCLDRWSAINGSPSHLLPPLSELPPATGEIPEPSITAYSFDRLVVCQSDEVARMLIANNFHFENNCAILAISGYPKRIFDTTMGMLRRNPDLRVFAFHDCSPEGIELAHRVRTDSRWFPDESILIINVGLSVRQILASKRDVFMRASKASAEASLALDPQVRQNLSKEELKWLDTGNFVELESFTPRTLIRVLQRSIANSQALSMIEENSLILVGESAGSLYAIDSFG